jgi:nitroreductase/NAD-dependent dihydropyrimidine dehydrogenase PreA subunit
MENKEVITIDENLCTMCGLCVPVCVRKILELGEESARVTEPARCILCGHCKAICPEDALQFPTLDPQEFAPAPGGEVIPRPEKLMAFFRSRRSTRMYQEREVEKKMVLQILEAGRFAPTGGNRQPLRFVVVHTTEKIAEVRRMAMSALGERARKILEANAKKKGQGEPLSAMEAALEINADMWLKMPELLRQGEDRLFYFAPSVILCHADSQSATVDVDAGLAGMQMTLMAEALGLGTCFCHFLVFAIQESAALKELLQIPAQDKVNFAFALGYPAVTFPRLVARNPAVVRWL